MQHLHNAFLQMIAKYSGEMEEILLELSWISDIKSTFEVVFYPIVRNEIIKVTNIEDKWINLNLTNSTLTLTFCCWAELSDPVVNLQVYGKTVLAGAFLLQQCHLKRFVSYPECYVFMTPQGKNEVVLISRKNGFIFFQNFMIQKKMLQ